MESEARTNFDIAGLEGIQAQALQAWKNQFDAALQLVEAMTEGATKMHEAQLEAATDAHANAVATQKTAAEAGGPIEFARIESQWMQHNLGHAAAYWRALFQAALETNASMMKCLSQQQQQQAFSLPGKPLDVDASKTALLGMVDNAYKQWLEASRRFYEAPAELVAAARKSAEQAAAQAKR